MTGIFIVSKSTLHDIEIHRLYLIAQNGEKISKEFLKSIYSKFNLLALFPHMGKTKENVSKNLLMFPDTKHHRSIYYRKTTFGVRIIRVLGSSQDQINNL